MGSLLSLFKQNDQLDYQSNYQGLWKSNDYPSVNGTLALYLPFAVQDTLSIKNFNGQCLIHYSETSSYKPGHNIKINLNGSIHHDIVRVPQQVPHYRVSKMSMQSVDQQIDYYVDNIDYRTNTINGHYISQMPSDRGSFAIKQF